MDLTYRVLRFQPSHSKGLIQYIAIAWNYKLPVMFTTYTCSSYAGARRELDRLVELGSYKLRYFDGEYLFDERTEQIVSDPVNNEMAVIQRLREERHGS
jgi:hypothetical protein